MSIRLLFEPRDLWLGAYWNLDRSVNVDILYVYICLIPMLPIRLMFRTRFVEWSRYDGK